MRQDRQGEVGQAGGVGVRRLSRLGHNIQTRAGKTGALLMTFAHSGQGRQGLGDEESGGEG